MISGVRRSFSESERSSISVRAVVEVELLVVALRVAV